MKRGISFLKYLVLIFIFNLLWCSNVFAYKVSTSGGNDIKWNTSNVTYYINSSGGPFDSLSAIQEAMQTWTDVATSIFTFVDGGTTTSTAYGINDGVNIVVFGPMGTTGTLAENYFWYYKFSGQMIDSDIKFNTDYPWATDGSPGAYDVQNIGTHEFGHSLSLDDLYKSADSEKTMYGYAGRGETKKRTLDQDDIDGITYLYPIPPLNAPSSLSATAVSQTQINLIWQDNSSDESDFHIERSPNGSTGWTEIATVGANTTGYNNTELTCNTPYYYRVRAHRHSDAQYSVYSNTANATTQACSPPNAPSGLGATPVSQTQINLSYQDNSSDESDFHIERSPDGSTGWAEITTVGANVSSYNNTGLTCNTPYYYRVRAHRHSDAQYSVYSNTANATTQACSAPNAPTSLNATAVSQTQINLSYQDNSSDESDFHIERSPNGSTGWAEITTVGANTTSYNNTGLTCNTPYYYRVRAHRHGDGQYSGYSNTANAITQACSGFIWIPIPGLTASSPALAWNPSANKLQMVVRASNDTLWASTFNSSGVFNNNWVNIPGLTASLPALAWNPVINKMQMVVRASNNTLWASTFNSSGTFNNDWVNIPGLTPDAPTLAWNPLANEMQLVVRGSDGSTIWESTFNSSGVFNNDWLHISGAMVSSPALAWNEGANEMQMVVRASNSTLWASTFSSSGVFNNDWINISGLTASSPALAWSDFTSSMHMMVRASNDTIWASTFNPSGVFNDDWVNIPGSTPSSPGMAYLPTIGYIGLVVRASNDTLWEMLY